MHWHINPSRKFVTSKPRRFTTRPHLPCVARRQRGTVAPREGSVLIVVIGMLLLLMLIGFTFFTFSSQEQSSAEYYADAAKVYSPADANILFDWALEQLIIGPHDNNTQSVLWPGNKSLVPNMLGGFTTNWANYNPQKPPPSLPQNTDYPTQPTDRHPFDGGWGINIISGPNGQVWLDQNFNGINDAAENPPLNNNFLFTQNWSPAATIPAGISAANLQGNPNLRQNVFNLLPALDVGYTYPDINNPFLAHIGYAPQNAAGTNAAFVVIPSFHRPQYMRHANGTPNFNWYNQQSGGGQSTTAADVLRPHPDHRIVLVDTSTNPPTFTPTNFSRFLNSPAAVPNSNPAHVIQYFGYPDPIPFGPNVKDSNGNYIYGQEGVWTNSPATNLAYDVDNDNDGIREGVWLDLNFPPSILPDGRIMVPLFSYTVMEADSLINLNAHGNLSGWLASQPPVLSHPMGNGAPLSHSNLGVSAAEVNPFWALVCDPMNTNSTFLTDPNSALQQYRGFYGFNTPASFGNVTRVEAANMDMLFLFWGRPTYSVSAGNNGSEQFSLANLTTGLWGEPVPMPGAGNGAPSLLTGLSSGNPGQSPPSSWYLFPRPGIAGTDDDGDRYAGTYDSGDMTDYFWPIQSGFPNSGNSTILYQYTPPFSQPLDYTGAGTFTFRNAANFMQQANLYNPMGTTSVFLQYHYYDSQIDPVNSSAPTAYNSMGLYQSVLGGNLSPNLFLTVNPITQTLQNGLIDEGDEVIPYHSYKQASDQIFTYDEIAAIQLSQADYLSSPVSSRLRQLMSLNFEANQQAAGTRQHFTTESWDRKQHAFAVDSRPTTGPNRQWEFTGSGNLINNWDGSGGNQFPPMVIGNPLNNASPSTTDSNGNAEPFRMALAALIGARLGNSPFSFAANANAFNTPAYDGRNPKGQMTPWQQQCRLNINRLLTTANDAAAFGTSNAQTNPLFYREFTPHPLNNSPQNSIPAGTIIPTTSPSGSFTTDAQSFSTNAALQEYWARRDRQLMARDIYVMLYLLGGGADTEDFNGNGMLDVGEDINNNMKLDTFVNYATTSNTILQKDPNDTSPMGFTPLQLRSLYSDRQLAEMAQFAVNVVDSLDRDDTITMFEYDKNLADGWNLDDVPATVDPLNTPTDRGVVYGVEAQQLAFNEALVIVATKVKDKNNNGQMMSVTYFDDSQADRTFTYLELQNVGPYAVPLANWNWQIQVLDSNSNPLSTLTLGGSAGDTINAGQQYVIGSRSYQGAIATDNVIGQPGTPMGSSFLVMPNWDPANPPPSTLPSNYTVIAPASGTINLDLVAGAGQPGNANNKFGLVFQGNATTVNGNLFYDFNAVYPADMNDVLKNNVGLFSSPVPVTFSLQRRLNLNRNAPTFTAATGGFDPTQNNDNPFVEVDRITYQISYQPDSGVQATITPLGSVFNLRFTDVVPKPGYARSEVYPKLQRLNGWQRLQPLDGYEGSQTLGYPSHVGFYQLPAPGTTTAIVNTLGQTNASIGPNFYGAVSPATLWQPHFDRDFASVTELLSIPLYGPGTQTPAFPSSSPPVAATMIPAGGLTQSLAPRENNPLANMNHNHLVVEVPTLVPAPPPPPALQVGSTPYLALTAHAKFSRPLYPPGAKPLPNPITLNVGAPNPLGDNRWYRILELLEVPTRQNMQVENFLQSNFTWMGPQALQRVAGRMNLNGLRYSENLFALLDDTNAFNVMSPTNPLAPAQLSDGSYPDSIETAGYPNLGSSPPRNWWFELAKARDGFDQTTQSYLPGSPASRPFRSFSGVENSPSSIQSVGNSLNGTDDTLLRTLVLDSSASPPLFDARRLFEARPMSDLVGAGGNNTVDYYTRNRLISKIAGNTTPRSNVFLVWVTVGFFEGYQPDSVNFPNAVQIGAEMTDQTRRRGFFVVDRSLLEDAWIAPQYDVNNNLLPNTGIYDFKKFVQYRKTVQ